eukprot:2398715-Rhodomonas_salina.1
MHTAQHLTPIPSPGSRPQIFALLHELITWYAPAPFSVHSPPPKARLLSDLHMSDLHMQPARSSRVGTR